MPNNFAQFVGFKILPLHAFCIIKFTRKCHHHHKSPIDDDDDDFLKKEFKNFLERD